MNLNHKKEQSSTSKKIKRAKAHFKDFGGSRTRNRTNKRTADLSTCKSTGNASDEQREMILNVR